MKQEHERIIVMITGILALALCYALAVSGPVHHNQQPLPLTPMDRYQEHLDNAAEQQEANKP